MPSFDPTAGLTSKIHPLLDASSKPVAFALSFSQAHDVIGVDRLLPGMTANLIIAYRAFDADERLIKSLLADKNKAVVIPSKANRKDLRKN